LQNLGALTREIQGELTAELIRWNFQTAAITDEIKQTEEVLLG